MNNITIELIQADVTVISEDKIIEFSPVGMSTAQILYTRGPMTLSSDYHFQVNYKDFTRVLSMSNDCKTRCTIRGYGMLKTSGQMSPGYFELDNLCVKLYLDSVIGHPYPLDESTFNLQLMLLANPDDSLGELFTHTLSHSRDAIDHSTIRR